MPRMSTETALQVIKKFQRQFHYAQEYQEYIAKTSITIWQYILDDIRFGAIVPEKMVDMTHKDLNDLVIEVGLCKALPDSLTLPDEYLGVPVFVHLMTQKRLHGIRQMLSKVFGVTF